MEEYPNRLHEVRIAYGLTLKQACDQLRTQLTPVELSGLEKGKYIPTNQLLDDLASLYQVDRRWLMLNPISAHMKSIKDFSNRLFLLRGEKRKSLVEVSNESGIKFERMHNLEMEQAEPTLAELITLSEYFGITIDELVGYEKA